MTGILYRIGQGPTMVIAGNVCWGRGTRKRLFSTNAAIASAINCGFGSSVTVVRWRLVKDMPHRKI